MSACCAIPKRQIGARTWLVDSLCHEIVYQNADVALGSANCELRTFKSMTASVDAGENALRGSLFVASGSVDLTGQEQPRNALRLERMLELSRVDMIVLDPVARSTVARQNSNNAPKSAETHVISTFSRPGIVRNISSWFSAGNVTLSPLG